MNVARFDRTVDAALGRAAESLALAREIEAALGCVVAAAVPERGWRRAR
jgi:hypothetical protein